MNILHINSEKGWRGGERQITYLVESMIDAGIGSSVLCKRDSKLHQYCVEHDIPYFTAPFRNSFDLETAQIISRIVKNKKFEIIHVHTPKAQTLSIISSIFGLKVPIVFTKRTSFKIKNNFLTLYKYNHPSIKKIIAISDRIADLLKAIIKEPAKIDTVYSCIDLNNYSFKSLGLLRKELNLPLEVRLVGIAAALSPEKDHLTFLKMAASLRKHDKNFHFVIIGEGPLEKQLKEQAGKDNLKDAVHFIGFRKNIYELLPELDVLLLTSTEEGLGSVILDAFASKVPVVATNAGGIPELVIHEKTGLIASVKDHEKLAENVTRVLNEPDLRERLITNAYDFVQGFSKEKTAERILAVYREILADKT